MWKGWNVPIALALLVILGAIILPVAIDGQPTYAGHTLSYWLETQGSPETTQAVLAIGTNAIPYLLRWAGEEPPQWKKKLSGIPIVRGNGRLLQILYGPATPKAVAGFAILRTNATTAIPALTKLMNNPTRPNSSITAMSALAYIGEQALPPLAAVLSETNRIRRFYALNTISHMPDYGTPKSACLVPLLKATIDPDPVLRTFATNAIHRIAPELLTNSPSAQQPPHR